MADDTQYIFYCRKCFDIFGEESNPPLIAGDEFACPKCAKELIAEPLLRWMKGLCAAHKVELTEEAREKCRVAGARASNTGPRSAAAKFRVSMNGFKNGAHSKKHFVPPARPGGYHACSACPFAPLSSNEQGDNSCQREKWNYCNKRGETIISVINAHHGEGPAAIAPMIAALQGMAMLNLQDALQQIAVEGPTIEHEILRPDKDGNPVECGSRVESNPALKAVDTFSAMLQLNLAQFNITPKSTTDKQAGDNLHDLLQSLLPKANA